MVKRLCLLLGIILLAAPLRAQMEGVIEMIPEFANTFPLAQNGHDITVKYPVMTNPTTVLKPGMVLRTMYILHTASVADDSDLVAAHKGNMEKAFSRESKPTDDKPAMPPGMAHEIEGYRRTVWTAPNNFMLAMLQFPTDALHLMYSPTGGDQDVKDTRFSFFDGLLVGLPGGKVTILAVEKDSRSERAGLKAGDEIGSVGGISTRDDLSTFANAYSTAKAAAKDAEVQSYPMVIRSGGKGEAHTVDVPMPPTLSGGLMHGI